LIRQDCGKVFEMIIDGQLDLHTFRPAEVKTLVADYIDACLEHQVYDLRIIHGKGMGVLKATVQSILSRHPAVAEYHTADETAGGWGATLVTLHRPPG
jgi:DNA-nicking Smr family endonuclease